VHKKYTLTNQVCNEYQMFIRCFCGKHINVSSISAHIQYVGFDFYASLDSKITYRVYYYLGFILKNIFG